MPMAGYSAPPRDSAGCWAATPRHRRELSDLLGTLDDPARVEGALDELRRGEAVDMEAWCWRAAEGPAAVCLVAAPLELNDPRAVSYCLVRDITDQRVAAEEHARALSLHQATLSPWPMVYW